MMSVAEASVAVEEVPGEVDPADATDDGSSEDLLAAGEQPDVGLVSFEESYWERQREIVLSVMC